MSGPTFNDVMTVGGASFTNFKLATPDAGWTCTGAAAPGMQCSHADPVPANTSVDLTFSFTPDAGSLKGATELKNCATLGGGAAPAAPAPNNAPLPPPPPPAGTNNGGLKVEMTPVVASCSPKGGNCKFKVTVINTTAAPITGPLKVSSTLSAGTETQAKNTATEILKPAEAQCTPEGREFSCVQDPLTLAPNQSTSFTTSFAIDTADGGPANFVADKAVVTFGPLAGDASAAIAFDEPVNVLPEPGAPAAQDQAAGGAAAAAACATLPVTAPAQTGPVVITKTGPAKCPIIGPCTFSITLANTTDAPIPGPIAFTDTIDQKGVTLGDAPIAAPFSCVKSAPPFKCTLGAPGLAAKESKTLSLELKFDLPDGTKSVKNCAVKDAGPAAAPAPGGGAAPDPAQKQFAPGKKSELLPFRSIWDRSRFEPAMFRSQSLAPGSGYLHLAGGAGGNIGGVGQNACLKWGMPKGGFNVTQSNGLHVAFSNMVVGADGQATGTASFVKNTEDAGNANVTGKVHGTILGGHVDLEVDWFNEPVRRGHFVGEIGRDGSFEGKNTASNSNVASFKSEKNWFTCALDDLCQQYAKDAMAAEQEFEGLKCGAVGAGRWSNKIDDHINWCMGQPRGGDSPIAAETAARKKELDGCREFDAECTTFGIETAAKADEMKALNCKEATDLTKPGAPSSGPDAMKKLCRLVPFQREAMKQDIQNKLDTCKARIAAGGDAAGGADGAGGQGQAAEPGPEQCAVVELEVSPAPPPVQQTNGLSISKVSKATACSNAGGCAFESRVKNDGNAPFKGQIELTEEAKIDGAFIGTIEIEGQPTNPFTCTKNGLAFSCKTPPDTFLGPQADLQLLLSFKPGNVGAAKLFENCATIAGTAKKACATIPMGPVPEPPPQPDQVGPAPKVVAPNLRVKKFLMRRDFAGPFVKCSVTGKCPFIVVVENAGNGLYEGTIDLSDEVQDRRPGLMEMLPTKNSGWSCGGISNNTSLSCQHAATKLAPGESVSLLVAVTPGPNWKKNDTLTNCAELTFRVGNGPLVNGNDPGTINGDDKACAKVILDPFAVSVKKTGDASCAPGSDCKFQISVFNPGPIDHNAPVTISDKLTGISSAQILSINPPLPCATQPTQVPFTCTTPGDYPLLLGPNGEPSPPKTFDMVLRLPNDASAAQFTNCAGVAPDAKSGPANESCVTIATKPKETAAEPQLIIEKRPTVASCDDTGSPCSFDVTVTNQGAGPTTAPIKVYDVQSFSGQDSTKVTVVTWPAAPWSCLSSAGPGMTCTHPGPIAPGGSVKFSMVLQPQQGAFGMATDIKNCATLEGVRPGRATSCATITRKTAPRDQCSRGMVLTNGICACPDGKKWNGRECADTGQGSGGASTSRQPGDVTGLKIAKKPTAASCTDAGGGCTFDITVTNGRSSAFAGPITVLETIKADGELAASSDMRAEPPAPWHCDKSSSAHFTCTHPGPLAAGESLTLPVNFGLRADTGARSIQNCAEIKGGDGPACASILLSDAAPIPPAQPASSPNTCTSGMVATSAGLCACASGSHWNGRSCSVAQKVCPAGTSGTYPDCGTGGTNGTKPSQSEAPKSERPKTETPKKVDSPKETHVCKGDRPVGTYPNCCPTIAPIFSKRDGRCHPVEKKEQPPVNPGELLSKTCPDGSKVPVFKKCPSGNGGTNTQSQPPQHNCPPGYRVLDKPNRYGAYCEAPASTGKCPPSAPEGSPPNCHCPAGTVSREGFCRPATCGPNMTGVPPNCHRVCPAGTVNQNKSCVPISKPGKVGPAPKPVPTPPKCLGDKVLINGVCRCPSSAPKDIGHNRCDSGVH